jgi:hypothetical protein
MRISIHDLWPDAHAGQDLREGEGVNCGRRYIEELPIQHSMDLSWVDPMRPKLMSCTSLWAHLRHHRPFAKLSQASPALGPNLPSDFRQ